MWMKMRENSLCDTSCKPQYTARHFTPVIVFFNCSLVNGYLVNPYLSDKLHCNKQGKSISIKRSGTSVLMMSQEKALWHIDVLVFCLGPKVTDCRKSVLRVTFFLHVVLNPFDRAAVCPLSDECSLILFFLLPGPSSFLQRAGYAWA